MRRNKSRLFKTSLLYGAVISVLAAGPVFAADNEEATAEEDSNVIVVTARKKRETIIEVPMNISTVGAQEIADRNLITKEEIYRSIAGAANPRGELILRGLSGGNSAFPGTSSSFTDGIPWDFSELFDVERVEVLRGPQGTLWGSNAIGGTVQVITNKPVLNELEVFGQFQTSDEAHIDGIATAGFAGINLPLAEDWALRITGNSAYAPKKMTNAYTGNQGHGESQFLRTQLLWQASDDMSINMGYVREQSYHLGTDIADRAKALYYARADLTPNPDADFGYDVTVNWFDCASPEQERAACLGTGTIVNSDPKYTNYERFDEWAEREFDLYSVTIEHANIADIASMSYVGSYREYYNGSLDNWSRLDAVDMFDTWIINDFSGNRTTHELRFQNLDVDSSFDWTVGYFYDKIDDGDNPNGQFQYHGNGDEGKAIASYYWGTYWGYFDPRPDEDTDPENVYWSDLGVTNIAELGEYLYNDPNKNYNISQLESWSTEQALFGEATYNTTIAGKKFELTGGIRFFELENYSLIGETGIWVGPEGGITETGSKETGNRKKVSASWMPDNESQIFAVYSEGYRPGSANMSSLPQSCRNDSNAEFFLPSYKSDEIENYEIGYKGSFNNGDFFFSAAAYQINWSEVQVSIYMPTCGFSYTYNAEDARSRGLEFESRTKLTNDLTLTVNAGYTDSEMLDDIPAIRAKAGDDMTMVPKFNAYLALDQGFKLYNKQAYVRVDMQAYGEYKTHFGGARNTYDDDGVLVTRDTADIAEAYEVINLSGRVEINDNLNLSLHINNLFDKEYTTYQRARSRNSGNNAALYTDYGDNRTMTLRVDYRF